MSFCRQRGKKKVMMKMHIFEQIFFNNQTINVSYLKSFHVNFSLNTMFCEEKMENVLSIVLCKLWKCRKTFHFMKVSRNFEHFKSVVRKTCRELSKKTRYVSEMNKLYLKAKRFFVDFLVLNYNLELADNYNKRCFLIKSPGCCNWT